MSDKTSEQQPEPRLVSSEAMWAKQTEINEALAQALDTEAKRREQVSEFQLRIVEQELDLQRQLAEVRLEIVTLRKSLEELAGRPAPDGNGRPRLRSVE